MLTNLILLFVIIPAVELYLLIKIGANIGALNTILIIVITGILGAYLARLQGFITLNRIQNSLNKGMMPSEEMMDGLMILRT